MYYAGIGARKTPDNILRFFQEIGKELAEKGCILRSGRAEGADTAFEKGCIVANGKSEIILPWQGFPKNSELNGYPAFIFNKLSNDVKKKALESIATYHPQKTLSPGVEKLMARNYCQLYGPTSDSEPSRFVICWTPGGKETGGTGQAIRIANAANIKIFNAGAYADLDKLRSDILNFVEEMSFQ